MAKHLASILIGGLLFVIADSAFAQLTNSGQLAFEAAKRILEKGNSEEALQRFDKLIIAGFQDREIYKQRGIARYNLKDYDGATQDLDKVRGNENDAQVPGLIGICRYYLHEYEASKYFLKIAIEAGFKDAKAHLYLGYLYLDEYQYKEALIQLTEAEKEGETEVKLFESKGIAAFYTGQPDLAITDLEKLLKAKKGSLIDYEVLGMAYSEMDKPLKALPHLQKADSLHSQNKDVYFHLGNSLSVKGLYKLAINAYTKSIDLNYNKVEVYINRGNSRLGAGLIKESIVDFDKAIAMTPEKSIGYRCRAAANTKLENWAGVITDLAIANALGDFDSNDRIALSIAKYNIKNYQGALVDVTSALENGDQHYFDGDKKHSLYLHKGKCLVALKKYDEAIIELNHAEKNGETDVELYILRARALVGTQNFESAIKNLETAQKSSPKNATVFYNSAIIKEELGDFGAAVLDYTRAITLNPKDDLAFYGRASCKARKGEMGDALTDMDTAIKLDDKNAAYYKMRANFHYQMNNKDKACFDWRKAVEFGDEKARFSIEQYCNKK